ncbi:MAG: hypothetical protein U0269_24225 [Polyangiales bacterium]
MSNPIVFRVREFNIICSRGADGEPVATELRSLDGELVPAHRAMKLWRAKSMGSALARALHEARLAEVAPSKASEPSAASHDASEAPTEQRDPVDEGATRNRAKRAAKKEQA